jgi:hypothetical protein
VASLGLHKGVAQVYGVKITGLPAWFMHRAYHMSRIPSLNRAVRVVVDWTPALFLKREVVSLGELHQPREPFTVVTPTVLAVTVAPSTRDRPHPHVDHPLSRAAQLLHCGLQGFGVRLVGQHEAGRMPVRDVPLHIGPVEVGHDGGNPGTGNFGQ